MKNALKTLTTDQNNKITTGFYRSHDNKIYMILGSGKDASSLEDIVIYQSIFKDSKFGDYPIWIMPLSIFLGKICVNEKEVLRFNYLGYQQSLQYEQEIISLMRQL